MKYKVTLYLEASTHPRKWVPDVIWESLEGDEDILNYRIEEITEEDEQCDNKQLENQSN